MYTESVRFRAFTCVLTLLVATAPVIGVICELDCDAPKAARQTCHEPVVTRDAMIVRAAGHACRHQPGPTEATVTNASARDFGTSSIATFLPIRAFLAGRDQIRPNTVHGPPGSRPRGATSLTLVLRI
jgi:hypothetical protein